MKMPLDRKRINGPESTVPYQLFVKLNTKSVKQQFQDLFTSDGTRKDSRQCLEHRKIFLKTGVVSAAKGSAYIEVGQTKVIVSVFDPREIPNKSDYCLKGEIYCEFKYASFSCPKRRLHQQDNEEKLCSSIMKQALESCICLHEFPNYQIDIYALVIHNDGSALSAAITAAGTALAHACVPMYDVITSVTLGVQGKHRLLNPTYEEEELCALCVNVDEKTDHGLVIMSYLHTHEQVSQFYQSGNMDLEVLNECMEVVLKSCQDLVPCVQKCLVNNVTKSLKDKKEKEEESLVAEL